MELDVSEAVAYHEDAFPPNINITNLINQIIAATQALSKYDQMLETLHNSELFLAPLRQQEAVVSSRMEGTISTIDEIMQIESEIEDDPGAVKHTRSDVIETALYSRSLSAARKQINDGQPISPHLLKSMHQQLLSFGRGATKSPGKFKDEQNYIGDDRSGKVAFIPISPEKLDYGIDLLFATMNDDDIPIILRAALAHVEFEALHPFKDGNGRVGRMLVTLMLWVGGAISAPHFYISKYFEEHKDQYIETMRNVSLHGDWESWCKFFLTAVTEQALHNLKIANQISELYENMKPVFAERLGSKWSVTALDTVFTFPVFRNRHFTTKGIPPQTASRFSRILIESELIMTIHEAAGQSPALYRFEPLLRIVRT